MLLTQLLYHGRNIPQLTPRQPRKQMVFKLKLKPPKEPIHPRRASYVDSPTRLLLEPVVPLWRSHINIRGKMVQTELHVLNRGHAETGKNEENPLAPIRQARDEKRKPRPKNENPGYVQKPIGNFSLGKQEQECLEIEIHSSHAHHGVEREMLIAH